MKSRSECDWTFDSDDLILEVNGTRKEMSMTYALIPNRVCLSGQMSFTTSLGGFFLVREDLEIRPRAVAASHDTEGLAPRVQVSGATLRSLTIREEDHTTMKVLCVVDGGSCSRWRYRALIGQQARVNNTKPRFQAMPLSDHQRSKTRQSTSTRAIQGLRSLPCLHHSPCS